MPFPIEDVPVNLATLPDVPVPVTGLVSAAWYCGMFRILDENVAAPDVPVVVREMSRWYGVSIAAVSDRFSFNAKALVV